jgi:VIT1/CCC1 family predicted Fe2+/Mn2+ transporter
VSNASLVLGVAGAGAASGYVLTTGVAGLLAGALSMAAGARSSPNTRRRRRKSSRSSTRRAAWTSPGRALGVVIG